MTPTEQIEGRLRAALEAQSRAVQVSPDAWQRNQRRVAADRSRRNRMLLGAAAAVVAVAAVLGAGALLGGGGSGGSSAGGSDGPFTTRYLLGAPVEAETLTIDGEPAVHEIALSDMTGEGPNLCERYVAASSDSGGCTSREPSADKPGVAFDWLSGTEGGGDLRGVLAGVDGRVTKVRIWMDNGDMVLAELHPTGWEGTRMFALTTKVGGPVAQRLVAYGPDRNAVQAVDLPSRFGATWLAPRSACAGDRVARGAPDGDASVELGTQDARLSTRGPIDNAVVACIERLLPRALAGWHQAGTLVVAVVAPEVESVELTNPEPNVIGLRLDQAAATPVSGSPWRIATLRVDNAAELGDSELVAYDESGQEVDRAFLNQPPTP